MMKRNFLYSLSASVLLAGAVSAWTVVSSGEAERAAITEQATTAERVATLQEERAAMADQAALLPAEPGQKSAAAPTPTGSPETGGALPVNEELTYEAAYANHVQQLYRALGLEQEGLRPGVFNKALTGFYNLKAAGELTGGKEVLSIIDFTKSSREKRLWIIDLDKKKLLYRTLVAHGQGSGGEKATRFSNTESSHQSSLGFYVTGEVYHGKHGRSLRLDGMDAGFNTRARERAIVLHGADYVSQAFIDRVGRLGRSFGCPAVPVALSSDIIDHIREKTVLYIHGPQEKYESDYLNELTAARYFQPSNG